MKLGFTLSIHPLKFALSLLLNLDENLLAWESGEQSSPSLQREIDNSNNLECIKIKSQYSKLPSIWKDVWFYTRCVMVLYHKEFHLQINLFPSKRGLWVLAIIEKCWFHRVNQTTWKTSQRISQQWRSKSAITNKQTKTHRKNASLGRMNRNKEHKRVQYLSDEPYLEWPISSPVSRTSRRKKPERDMLKVVHCDSEKFRWLNARELTSFFP